MTLYVSTLLLYSLPSLYILVFAIDFCCTGNWLQSIISLTCHIAISTSLLCKSSLINEQREGWRAEFTTPLDLLSASERKGTQEKKCSESPCDKRLIKLINYSHSIPYIYYRYIMWSLWMHLNVSTVDPHWSEQPCTWGCSDFKWNFQICE